MISVCVCDVISVCACGGMTGVCHEKPRHSSLQQYDIKCSHLSSLCVGKTHESQQKCLQASIYQVLSSDVKRLHAVIFCRAWLVCVCCGGMTCVTGVCDWFVCVCVCGGMKCVWCVCVTGVCV